jgi:hypothetical protein
LARRLSEGQSFRNQIEMCRGREEGFQFMRLSRFLSSSRLS